MRCLFRICRYVAVLLALMTLHEAAHAQNCTFSVGYTDFGTISALQTEPQDIVGGIHILCTGYSTPMVRMCLNISATAPRQLIGPNGAVLNYNLYVDPDHNSVWGSVTAPNTAPLILDLPVYPSGNVWANEPFYGRIPPKQNVAVGTYTQPFTATDTYFVYVGYSGTPPNCATSTAPFKTAPFTVTANVGVDCDISATPMRFGSTSLLNESLQATSRVTVTCVTGVDFFVDLDGGTTPGGSITQRKLLLEGGADTIDYQLYLGSSRAEIWGDGSNGTVRWGAIGTGTAHSMTVYGLVPPQPSKTPGRYTDTITATVSF
ncbi:secreted pili protein involved in motility and biofilm formation [Caballeronia catudaia]|uniref:Secreted pili protein involved in motility and biofilm formation n=1 Tax=Caballeronia catudaia TaxID=1777136 RepID=A0A158C0Z4_9BURK|nr:spore coat protein U domain-containing protein [Caballeronia catudaia]SAK75197.1 secreted pili protein involved in motility and biofilm formation [Caballeronia catudaia]